MPKKKPFSKQTQFVMFPNQMKPGPKEFARNLQASDSIAKSIRRSRPKERKLQNINVIAAVESAYSVLFKAKGFNVEGFVEILKNAPVLNAEAIVRNNAIVSSSGKSSSEMREISIAVKTIIYYVGRQRKRKEYARLHVPDIATLAEKSQQKKHMDSIAKE